MAVSNTPPNTDNYYIGKGVVWWQPDGDVGYNDLGNVSVFEFTPTIETLEHVSNRAGVRATDRKVVVKKSATLRMIMDEMTADNLAMGMLGTAVPGAGSSFDINIFEDSEVLGSIYFIGANDIGPKLAISYPAVSFVPSAAFSPLSDEWGGIEVLGDVLVDPLNPTRFGTINWNTTLTAPP